MWDIFTDKSCLLSINLHFLLRNVSYHRVYISTGQYKKMFNYNLNIYAYFQCLPKDSADFLINLKYS
jgi:hypothetical protein